MCVTGKRGVVCPMRTTRGRDDQEQDGNRVGAQLANSSNVDFRVAKIY